jgi:methylated-DNA-protein-cysteine methyltransferase-like protein
VTAGRPTDDFAAAVREVLLHLQRGEVVSYGWVADEAGSPRRARAVAALLSAEPDTPNWWRVVATDDRLAARPERPGRR